MIVSKIFPDAYPAPMFRNDSIFSTQPRADYICRIVLMFGAVPAALTYYWWMKILETARYTALVKGDHEKAASDMAKVLDKDIMLEKSGSQKPSDDAIPQPSYRLFSAQFLQRHGLHLLGTASTWFLLDVAF